MRRTLLLTLALLVLPTAQAAELKPFSASYTADWTSVPVSGTAKRTLEERADGTWELGFNASMLITNFTEVSTFRLEGNKLQALHYELKRTGLGRAKHVEHKFNWSTKQVTGTDGKDAVNLPLTPGLLDKSSYQVALQLDVMAGKHSMTYQVLDGDDIDTYDFRVLGEELVETKVGKVNAIKVERVRDPTQSKRQTTLWFAKDWDCMLVQLHQTEKDGKEYQIVLEQGILNNQPLKGK